MLDEQRLSEKIFTEGQLLAPIALITASFLVFGSDAWLIAFSSCILMLAYVVKGWNVKILLSYGVLMLLLCAILVFTVEMYAAWAAIQSYWFLASATLGMLIVAVRESQKPALANRKPKKPKKYSRDLMKKRPVA